MDLLATASDATYALEFAISGTSASAINITGISSIARGAVLDLEPEGISKATLTGAITNQWIDSSGNGLHGTATMDDPSAYIAPELGFSDVGDVTSFAATKLQLSNEYGLWRLKRMAQCKADIAAILA